MYKDISGYLSNVQDAGNYAIQVGTGGYTAEVQKSIFLSVSNLIGEITTQYVMRYHPDLKTDCSAGPAQMRPLDEQAVPAHQGDGRFAQRNPALSRWLLSVPAFRSSSIGRVARARKSAGPISILAVSL